ncbi:MAG TPA: hypothetical protein VJA27_01495 [Patescibacteria group bacterium]|nr:hypothetical protein [Patescibacteria group bacterium]
MPGFREGGRPGSDKPKRELSSANFLQKHKEEMIAQPERINELLQELPEKKKAEVIDHFLGNFYMRLPGGSKRHVEVEGSSGAIGDMSPADELTEQPPLMSGLRFALSHNMFFTMIQQAVENHGKEFVSSVRSRTNRLINASKRQYPTEAEAIKARKQQAQRRSDLHAQVLPVYIRLRSIGFSHEDLTS